VHNSCGLAPRSEEINWPEASTVLVRGQNQNPVLAAKLLMTLLFSYCMAGKYPWVQYIPLTCYLYVLLSLKDCKYKMLPNLHSNGLRSLILWQKRDAQGRTLWEGSGFPLFALQKSQGFSIKLSVLLIFLINCHSLKNICLHFGASAPPFITPTKLQMCQNLTASCPNFHFIATHGPIKIN